MKDRLRGSTNLCFHRILRITAPKPSPFSVLRLGMKMHCKLYLSIEIRIQASCIILAQSNYPSTDSQFNIPLFIEERAHHFPSPTQVQATLDAISRAFANQVAQQAANLSNLPAILATSPQTITTPIAYEIVNLAPFNVPVYVEFESISLSLWLICVPVLQQSHLLALSIKLFCHFS